MSKAKSSTKWVGDMAFEAEVSGHKFYIDADDAVGGHDKGPRPKPLMLTALAGCTAMDVIAILKKMRVSEDIEDFTVNVEGDITEEHPKHFHKMHIIYEFTPKAGKELPMDKLEKAVNLSQERYCGVSFSYKQIMDLTFEIKVN